MNDQFHLTKDFIALDIIKVKYEVSTASCNPFDCQMWDLKLLLRCIKASKLKLTAYVTTRLIFLCWLFSDWHAQ